MKIITRKGHSAASTVRHMRARSDWTRFGFACLLTLILFPASSNAQTKPRKGGAKPVLTVHDANHPVISANGQRIVVGPEVGVTLVYDVVSGRLLRSFRIPNSFGHAISADGNQVAVFVERINASDGVFYKSTSELWLFDIESGKELQHKDATVKREGVVLRNLVVSSPGIYSDKNISSDMRFIADVSTHSKNIPPDSSGVLIGDSATNSVLKQFGDYSDLYDTWGRATITPDAKLLAATRYNNNNPERNQTIVWDVLTGRELLHLPFHSSWLALSCDGKSLATQSGSAYKVEVWSIVSKKRISEIGVNYHKKRPRITRFALSPDGKLLATSGTNQVLLWDTQSGTLVSSQIHAEASNEEYVDTVSFSDNGKYLVMGSTAEVVKVWLLADVLGNARL